MRGADLRKDETAAELVRFAYTFVSCRRTWL
jgi:hypothetical protein